jgi:hypothetical protein
MNAKKLFPITLLLIASLACSLFEGVIPDVRAATSALTGEIELQAEAEPDEDQTPEAASVQRTVSTGSEFGQHSAGDLTYPIVDTGQSYCYDDGVSMPCPIEGESFYGQDAQYNGNAPSYTDNGARPTRRTQQLSIRSSTSRRLRTKPGNLIILLSGRARPMSAPMG